MKKFTNHSPGLRGINTTEGLVYIEAGQSVSLDPKSIVGALPDLGKAPAHAIADEGPSEEMVALQDRVMALSDENDALQAKVADLSGALAERDAAEAKRISTSGKNKAQLLALAAEEGVKIEDGATNADIASAIELAREEAAKAA